MFGGGEQNALFHEARGITSASNIVPLASIGKLSKSNAAKHECLSQPGGYEVDVAVHTSVEAHTLCERLIGDSCLEHSPNLF